MNKTPHYSLDSIKKLINEGKSKITSSAILDAAIHDMTEVNIKNTVLLLSSEDFYKTMQSNKNVLIWQDVYHKKVENVLWYVKLQIVGKAIIVSFKEK